MCQRGSDMEWKKESFHQMALGKIGHDTQENEPESHCSLCTKSTLNGLKAWVSGWKLSGTKRKDSRTLDHVFFRNVLRDWNRSKKRPVGLHQNKWFLNSKKKKKSSKTKRCPTERENIFTECTPNR